MPSRTRPRICWMLLATLVLAAGSGCASWYTIPNNIRSLTLPQGPYNNYPGPRMYWEHRAVTLAPGRVVAPLNTSVVLVAGVCAYDGRLAVDQKIEWTLDSGGVGHIVDFEQRPAWKWLLGPMRYPRKLGNDYAIGMTSDTYWRLTRDTPTRDDDVVVRRGQTWLTVTSPVEGTTYVTALSADVHGWDQRRKAATIHWVDAEWTLPSASSGAMGAPASLTTTVLRHSDRAPLSGWTVRYQITGGAPAGFAPDNGQSIELRTDAAGQAVAELRQSQPERGTTNVSVQVFRPGELAADGKPLLVAEGAATHAWAAAELTVAVSAPTQVQPGGTIRYLIEVANRGESAARNVQLTDEVPAGTTYLDSSPEGRGTLRRLTWMFDEIPAQSSKQIVLNLRADAPGDVNNCVTATAADGLSAQNCAATRISAPASLEVTMTGPAQAAVGQDLDFEIVIVNRGASPAAGLKLLDRFDPGLAHETTATGPIERELQDLPAGGQRRIGLRLRANRPGRWCNSIEVSAAGGAKGTAQACVEVSGTAAPSPATPPAGSAALSIKKTGPPARKVGEIAEFQIEVVNRGAAPANNVVVVDQYDAGLTPELASEGNSIENGNLVWRLKQLNPGQSETFMVHCRCQRDAARVCNRASASAQGIAAVESEACLVIQPGAAPGGVNTSGTLELVVSDKNDPVEVGRQLTYEIRITNHGARDERQLQLDVLLPTTMTPVPLGTKGPSRFEIDGQTVRFRALPDLRAGDTFTIVIRARANRAGASTLRADLSGPGLPQPLSASEKTDLFNPQ